MRVAVALMAVVLAGCATAPEPVQDVEEPQVLAAGAHLVGQAPERMLYGPTSSIGFHDQLTFSGPCDGWCMVKVDPTGRSPAETWLDVRVAWDGTQVEGFELEVQGRDGLAVPMEVRRGFDVVRAVVWGPEPGAHRIIVHGTGDLTGTVRLRALDVPALPGPDLLPNLVTLTPLELAVAQCKIEESVEEGAVRCLRLGNSVGNIGDGPLEVHLDHANAALSAAGQGRFVQRVYQAGGHRDVEASGAELHVSHGHFHYAGLAHFEIYPVGEDGLRGDMAAIGHKRGFCFLDWGEMDTPEAPPEQERHAEQNCLVPDPLGGWSMGISRGWYDYYWAELADQYIDIEGVPDGTYELVSIADGAGTLVETDETDNTASVLLRLDGDRVTVLEERALYDNPEAEGMG